MKPAHHAQRDRSRPIQCNAGDHKEVRMIQSDVQICTFLSI